MIFGNTYLADKNISSISYSFRHYYKNYEVFSFTDDSVLIKEEGVSQIRRLKIDGTSTPFDNGADAYERAKSRFRFDSKMTETDRTKFEEIEERYKEGKRLLRSANKINFYCNSRGSLEVNIKMNNGDTFTDYYSHWNEEFRYDIKESKVLLNSSVPKVYKDEEINIDYVIFLINNTKNVPANNFSFNNSNKVFI